MIKIFIDTSVLYSACESRIGASARILQLCRQNKIQGYISEYVIDEIKRNALMKLDQKGKQRLNFYMLQGHLLKVNNPTEEEIMRCEVVIHEKDAPILAAAFQNKCNYLVTFDIKDFMKQKVKEYVKPMQVKTPKDFIKLEKKLS